MKWRNKVLVAVVFVVVVLFVLPLLFSHNRAKSSLADYRKQLVARGEKLKIEGIAPHFTTEEKQSGRELLHAITLLGSFPTDHQPPTMVVLSPGRAMAGWKEAELPTSESSNVWLGARATISTNEERLAALRAALKKPVPGFDLNYNEGPALSIHHLAQFKSGAIWLSKAAVIQLHDGNPSEAWEDLMASVAMTKVCERESLFISQLVRIAMGQIAINATWEALQYPDWKDVQLAELQSAWTSVDFLNAWQRSLEMERATLSKAFELGRRDYTNIVPVFINYAPQPAKPTDLEEMLSDTKKTYNDFMDRYPRYWAWKSHWSYEEEHFGTEVLQTTLEAARKLQTNIAFAPALKELDVELGKLQQKHTNALAKFVLYGNSAWVARTVQRVGNVEMQRQLVVTAIALRRFQMANGKYPDELKELVPKFLAAVPLDPMDGNPLRYQNKSESFVLYSVGEDGVDGGGDAIPAKSSPGGNIQWFTGRDAVWPMPATAEEVAGYRQKTLATANWISKKSTFNPGSVPAPVKTN